MSIIKKEKVPQPSTTAGRYPKRRYRSADKFQVPVGIEKILLRAASDDDFKEKLLEDRAGAMKDSGVSLRPSEAAMLTAIPGKTLLMMVDNIIPENPRRRRFMGLVAAAAASLAAGTIEVTCGSGDMDGGTGPDTDVDVDTDTDGDTDTDTDTDSDTDTDVDGGPDGSI